MTRVLVFVPHYLPGEKAGGPARSIANLVEVLGDEYQFWIVTSEHDLGVSTRYESIRPGEWMTVGKARVRYVADSELTWAGVRALLTETYYDVLYLNGVLSDRFSIIPMVLRKLRLVPRHPVVIASRGEFAPGALALKFFKKRLFLTIARLTGFYRQPMMIWQASTSAEEADIRRVFQGSNRTAPTSIAPNLLQHRAMPKVLTAVDMATRSMTEPIGQPARKSLGELNAVFLSRISPMKNLLGLLKALRTVRGNVSLSVFGPIEDRAYWDACVATIRELPANVQVNYRGVVPNRLVGSTLCQYDLFVLPTLGENFGHVIAEALIAGCPVVTTDATPWREIETCGAGTIVQGSAPEAVGSAIQRYVDMDEQTLRRISRAAKALGERRATDPEAVAQNRALFVNAAYQTQVS